MSNDYPTALLRRRLYRRVRRILADGEAAADHLSGADEIRRIFGHEATRHLRSIVRLGGYPRQEHLVVMLRDIVWTELRK